MILLSHFCEIAKIQWVFYNVVWQIVVCTISDISMSISKASLKTFHFGQSHYDVMQCTLWLIEFACSLKLDRWERADDNLVPNMIGNTQKDIWLVGGNESMVVKRRQLEKQHRTTWLLLFTQIKFTGCWLAHFQQIKFWGTWSDVSCCKESGFDESQHNEPVDDRSWILVAVTVQSVALLCLMSSSIFLQWKWNCMQRHLANATCGDLVMNLTRANYGPQWSGIITNRNLTNLAATDKPQ